MHKLVLIRCGETSWDPENRISGWMDVELAPAGIEQAKQAGRLLKREGYAFDVVYTSVLKRATHTLWHMLDELDRTWLPVVHNWRLNARHYGALQGLSRSELGHQYGAAQVLIWLHSYDTPPPALAATDPRSARDDLRYARLPPTQVPLTESIRDTVARVAPFWKEALAPALRMGKRVLVTAHQDSLRALVKDLEDLSENDAVGLHIPFGVPLIYELDENLKPIRHYYLGQENDAAKVAEEPETQVKP